MSYFFTNSNISNIKLFESISFLIPKMVY